MAITAQKFLPQGKTGGDLTVTPKTSLIKSPKEGSNIVVTIKKKIILVDDLLKGTLAEKEKRQKDEIKQKEDESRAKTEKDKEKPDKKDEKETPKSLIPKLSFLDGIKKFLGDVLMGWLTFRLIKFLPQIVSLLKPLAAVADFLINFGGKLLDGLVTFIDIGYNAVKKTEEWIGDVFGDGAAKKFKNFSETFTKFLNVALIAAMVGAKAGMFGMGADKGVRRGVINKGKRIFKRAKRFFDPKRAEKLKRLKNIKKIKADRLLRVKKFGRLKKFAKAKQFVGKTTKAFGKVSKVTGKVTGKISQFASKNAGKVTGKISQFASKNAGKISKTAGKIVTRLGMKINTGMVQSMKGLSKMAKGVRIPIVGPIIAALTSYLADGKWDKALFIGLGTALGEMLGTAIPIPVIGTLLGGAIGYYIGDLLYTLFRGGGAGAVLKKLTNDIKKVLNVGVAVAKWTGKGFSRFYKGIPKVLIPDFPKDPPSWIPGFGFGSKEKIWKAARVGLKLLIGPLSLLMGKKIPILPWLMNPLKTTPLLIKSFFSRDPITENVFDPVKAVSSFFKGDGKKDKNDKKTEKKTTTKIERNEESYYSMLKSGKRSKIEQALYNLRIEASKGSGKAMNDWVGNKKYAGDVDLIMKHGLQKVEINNGRVTLQGNAENILPLDVNSIAKKTNNISNYDDEEKTIVIKSGSETGGDVVPETESKESLTPVVVGGGGGDSEVSDALYKGG